MNKLWNGIFLLVGMGLAAAGIYGCTQAVGMDSNATISEAIAPPPRTKSYQEQDLGSG